jgi:hypothetical protein
MKVLYGSFFFAALLVDWLPVFLMGQIAAVIADTDAAKYIGQKATVEGTAVEVFSRGAKGGIRLPWSSANPAKRNTPILQHSKPGVQGPIQKTVLIHRGGNK